MSINGVPSPTMPPGRGRSSIAQVAGRADDEATPPPRVAESAIPAPGTAPEPEPAVSNTVSTAEAGERATTYADPAITSSASSGSDGKKRGGRSRTVPVAAAGEKEKSVLLKLAPDLKARMVNTSVWTGPHTGVRNQQAFIRQAIAEKCERLEKQFNGGAPFPTVNQVDD